MKNLRESELGEEGWEELHLVLLERVDEGHPYTRSEEEGGVLDQFHVCFYQNICIDTVKIVKTRL